MQHSIIITMNLGLQSTRFVPTEHFSNSVLFLLRKIHAEMMGKWCLGVHPQITNGLSILAGIDCNFLWGFGSL